MQEKIKDAKEYANTEGVTPQLLRLLIGLDKRKHSTFYLKLSPEEKMKFVYGTYVGLAGTEPHLVLVHPKKYVTKNENNIASGIERIMSLGLSDDSENCCIAFDNIIKDTKRIPTPRGIFIAEGRKYEGRTYLAVNLFAVRAVRIHDEKGEFSCDFKLDFKFIKK